MNIILPENPFNYKDGAAVVEGNILYIYRQVDYYNLMAELTYSIYGRDKCHYCGRQIYESKLTIDHKIPRCFGGPTLTNNLVPACSHCNNRKSNMFEDEFFKILDMEAKHENTAEYRALIERRQKLIYKGKISTVPEEWLYHGSINVVTIRYQLNEPFGVGYKRAKKVFDKYNAFFKPIIISANRHVLDGVNVCFLAKIYNSADKVQIIQLDNVVCMY